MKDKGSRPVLCGGDGCVDKGEDKIQHSSNNSVVWTGSFQGADITLYGHNFQLGWGGHVSQLDLHTKKKCV